MTTMNQKQLKMLSQTSDCCCSTYSSFLLLLLHCYCWMLSYSEEQSTNAVGNLTHCLEKTAPQAHKKGAQKRVMIKYQLLLHCYTQSQNYEEVRDLLLLLHILLVRQVHQGCVKRRKKKRMALLTRTT